MDEWKPEEDRTLRERCHGNDAAIKAFFSRKIILAQLMMDYVPEYKGISREDIISKYIEDEPQVGEEPVDRLEASPKIIGSSTEDTTDEEGTVFYDVRFLASAPSGDGYIRLIINVEAQNRDKPGYPLVKRGLYYCSRLISAQKGTEFTKSDYGNIKKVYSIWICNRPTEGKNTIVRYRIRKEAVAGSITEPENNYDLLQVIILRMGEPDPKLGLTALNLLNTIFSNELSAREKREIIRNEYHFPEEEKMDEEMSMMCNISYGFYEEGLEKGLKKGLEKGREEGREEGRVEGREEGRVEGRVEGREEGRVEMLIGLVKDGLLSLKSAAARLDMKESDFSALMTAAK